METFSINSKCSKCGYGGANGQGNLEAKPPNKSMFLSLQNAKQEGFSHEVIKRNCLVCNYSYYEKPIDM